MERQVQESPELSRQKKKNRRARPVFASQKKESMNEQNPLLALTTCNSKQVKRCWVMGYAKKWNDLNM